MMFPLFDGWVLTQAIDQHEEIQMDIKVRRLEDQVRELKLELESIKKELRLEVESMKKELYVSRTFYSFNPMDNYTAKLSLKEVVELLIADAGFKIDGSQAKKATATLTKVKPRTRTQKLCKWLRGDTYD